MSAIQARGAPRQMWRKPTNKWVHLQRRAWQQHKLMTYSRSSAHKHAPFISVQKSLIDSTWNYPWISINYDPFILPPPTHLHMQLHTHCFTFQGSLYSATSNPSLTLDLFVSPSPTFKQILTLPLILTEWPLIQVLTPNYPSFRRKTDSYFVKLFVQFEGITQPALTRIRK